MLPAIFIDREFALKLDANKIITMNGSLEIAPKLYNDRYIIVLDIVEKGETAIANGLKIWEPALAYFPGFYFVIPKVN